MSSYDYHMNKYYGIGAVNGPPSYYMLGQDESFLSAENKKAFTDLLRTGAAVASPFLMKDSKGAPQAQVLVAQRPVQQQGMSGMQWAMILGGLGLAGAGAYYFMRKK